MPCQSRRNGWRISLTAIGARGISPKPGHRVPPRSLACRGSRPTNKKPSTAASAVDTPKAHPVNAQRGPVARTSVRGLAAGATAALLSGSMFLGPSPSKPPRSITTQGRRPRRRRTRAGWRTTGPATRRRARIRASPPSGSCRASREAPSQPSRHSGSASTALTTATSSRPAPRPTTTTARRITPRGGRSCLPRRPSSRRSRFVPATT